MSDKENVHRKLVEDVNGKIAVIQTQLDALKSDLESDTKSTAGDKHETSRAMIHLEQERLAAQLDPLQQMKGILSSLDPSHSDTAIKQGSLIETDSGNYYLSVGFGKIDVNGTLIFCLSPSTPIAQLLLGKEAGDSISFNGKEIKINKVS